MCSAVLCCAVCLPADRDAAHSARVAQQRCVSVLSDRWMAERGSRGTASERERHTKAFQIATRVCDFSQGAKLSGRAKARPRQTERGPPGDTRLWARRGSGPLINSDSPEERRGQRRHHQISSAPALRRTVSSPLSHLVFCLSW